MKSRQFPSFDDALHYLEQAGTLTFYGRAGRRYEYCVYTLKDKNGRIWYVDVYNDGKVVVRE